MTANRWVLATLGCVLGIGGVVRPAHACGGFFCSTVPVDQSGETVVYSFEPDGDLTMSVQIDYEGEDDDFAWILPVPVPPELSVGSDALFEALELETRPRFVLGRRVEGTCRPHPTCVREGSCDEVYGCSGAAIPTGGMVDRVMPPPDFADPGPVLDAGAPDPTGVTVFSQGTVGPYDTVVLGAATAAEVLGWLGDNGYDIPVESGPLLEVYAVQSYVFVALRLSANARSGRLSPITMRMATDEACLPIRLTAIATVPDMPIRAFFLGDGPVHTTNYNHAEVDTTALDLYTSRGATYFNRASNAVDELGGRAFVTDYAGPMPAFDLVRESVLDLAGEEDPAALLRALSDRGYQGDSRMLDIVTRHLAPPEDAAEDAAGYYNCLAIADVDACGEPSRYDPARLVRAVEEEITVPRRQAQARLDAHPYLTRLFTTMSASEMTVDPVFAPDVGLPDVPNVHGGTYVSECSPDYFEEDAPTRYDIADVQHPGRTGVLANDAAYCRDLGGIPIADAPSCEEPSRSGCALYPALGAPLTATAPLLAFGLLLLRRVRRRR
ncbi:MAG: DUF2330 domain-containing protein [Sandaracinaceae bacterium]